MAKLCPRGKAAAKRKFKVYPSAYANMYASAVCSGKITPGGKKGRTKKSEGGKIKKVFPTNPSREQEARDYYTRKFGSKKAKAELGAKTRDRRKVKKVHGKKEGGVMEPYFGSMISGTVDGKKLSNPSYKKYYGSLLKGMK